MTPRFWKIDQLIRMNGTPSNEDAAWLLGRIREVKPLSKAEQEHLAPLLAHLAAGKVPHPNDSAYLLAVLRERLKTKQERAKERKRARDHKRAADAGQTSFLVQK